MFDFYSHFGPSLSYTSVNLVPYVGTKLIDYVMLRTGDWLVEPIFGAKLIGNCESQGLSFFFFFFNNIKD